MRRSYFSKRLTWSIMLAWIRSALRLSENRRALPDLMERDRMARLWSSGTRAILDMGRDGGRHSGRIVRGRDRDRGWKRGLEGCNKAAFKICRARENLYCSSYRRGNPGSHQ